MKKIIVATLGAGALTLLAACGGGAASAAKKPADPPARHADSRSDVVSDAPSPPPGHDADWVVAYNGAYDLYHSGGGPQGRPVGPWCRGYAGDVPDAALLRQLTVACEAGIKAAGGP